VNDLPELMERERVRERERQREREEKKKGKDKDKERARGGRAIDATAYHSDQMRMTLCMVD